MSETIGSTSRTTPLVSSDFHLKFSLGCRHQEGHCFKIHVSTAVSITNPFGPWWFICTCVVGDVWRAKRNQEQSTIFECVWFGPVAPLCRSLFLNKESVPIQIRGVKLRDVNRLLAVRYKHRPYPTNKRAVPMDATTTFTDRCCC